MYKCMYSRRDCNSKFREPKCGCGRIRRHNLCGMPQNFH